SPMQNKPPCRPIGLTAVGRVLFPEGVANLEGDNVKMGDGPTHRFASDRFFRMPDSSMLVFADQYDGHYSAVLVNVRPGRLSTSALELTHSGICPESER